MDLHVLWFAIIGVLLIGYAILDGFDLGVGILHLCVRTDHDRRILLNSIGPLWDGNEVWLVTFGGALFAAFPDAYATAFSSFYVAFMALLLGLIFRAVSIEFRSKSEWPPWRIAWDIAFSAASVLTTFLYGLAVGNCMLGLPIGTDREFAGHFTDQLGLYPVMTGLFAVATFAMHGSIYLYLKTEGELQSRVRRWVWRTFAMFVVLYLLVTALTLVQVPAATQNFYRYPWLVAVVVLNVLAIANIPRAMTQGRPMYAFLSSGATIAAFTFLFGVALFPNLMASTLGPENNLTIYNSASSDKTLGIMLVVAILGLPFVISYTAVVYWIFRGKVQLGKFSY